MVSKTYLVGFLILVISATALYVNFNNQASLQVNKGYSDFFLVNSTTNVSYLGGREYVYLYNGTTQLKPTLVNLTWTNQSGIITYLRTSKYNGSLILIDTYTFFPNESKIENFPINETHMVLNGEGLKLQYKVTQLKTDKAKTFTGLEADFGNSMKISWEEGYNSAKVTKAGTFTLNYNITTNNFQKKIRLFDPVLGDGWFKKKPITINTTTNATNYQINLNVTYDSYIKTDFSDVRFLNEEETTVLDYYLANKVNSTWAMFIVEVDSIDYLNGTQIWMYYNNSGASSTSNGNNTFLFFDDFSSASLDTLKWTTSGGTVSGGKLNLSADLANAQTKGKANFTGNLSIETSIQGSVGNRDCAVIVVSNTEGSNLAFGETTYLSYGYYHRGEGNWSYTQVNLESNTSDSREYRLNISGTNISGSRETILDSGTNKQNYTITLANTTAGHLLYLNLTGGTSSYPGGLVDWIWVRAYLSVKPTYSIGSEVIGNITTNVTLYYANGTLYTDRYFEHGTTIQLKANITNSTGGYLANLSVCISIDNPTRGYNLSCANGTVNYNYTMDSARSQFSDGDTTAIINYTNANQTKAIYVVLNKKDVPSSLTYQIHGLQDPTYPSNIRVWVGGENVDYISESLVGDYSDSTVTKFMNNETSISFYPSQIIYVRLPANKTVTSGHINLNGTEQWSDWISTPTNASYTTGTGFTGASNAYDGDNTTYAQVVAYPSNTRTGYIYTDFNLTLYNITQLKIQSPIALHVSDGYSLIRWEWYNRSSSTWDNYEYKLETTSTGDVSGTATIDFATCSDLFNQTEVLKLRYYLETYCHSGSFSYARLFENQIALNASGYNVSIDGGAVGEVDYNSTGNFTSAYVTLNTTEIQNFLANCTADAEGYCQYPIIVSSSIPEYFIAYNLTIVTSGGINVSSRTIPKSYIQNYIDKSLTEGNISIPLMFYSSTDSSIRVDNLNLTYYGNDNVTLSANYTGDAVYASGGDKNYAYVEFSNFSIVSPDGYQLNDPVFMPTNLTQFNVSPYGQNATVPVWGIYSRGYDKNFSVWMRLGENKTSTCWNITVNTRDNATGNINLVPDTYQRLLSNISTTDTLKTQNLSAYFTFSDLNQTTTSSLVGNTAGISYVVNNTISFVNATLSNAVLWTNTSRWGAGAIKFEDSNYTSVGNTSDLKYLHDGSTDYTLSTWVRCPSEGGCNGRLSSTAGSDLRGVQLVFSGRDIQYSIGRTTPYPVGIIESVYGFPYDTDWHYISIVYVNNTTPHLKLYVDGILSASANRTNDPQSGNAYCGLLVGAYRNIGCAITTPFSNYYLDGLRIYKRALTSTELLADMEDEYPINPKNISLDLEFNEMTGTNSVDSKNLANGKYGIGAYFTGGGDYLNFTQSNMSSINFWYKTVNQTNWTFVTNNSGTMYVNGKRGIPEQFPIWRNATTGRLGMNQSGSFFNGVIDDLRIYNRSLSDEEIRYLYKDYPSTTGLWFYADLYNCSRRQAAYFNPTFDTKPICEECLYD